MHSEIPVTYREPYRPQFHFSPATNWLNDPNGLVFYDGEYHLFFQHDPYSLTNGPMHWGHAVSPDLIHWTHMPVALHPDAHGKIWSGSAVVDANNTSGLVPGGGFIAIFSYDNQSQGIACSRDSGRTWTMYDGNPIMPIGGKDFRDPKVFWHPETNRWVMILSAGDRAKLYTSSNLINWTALSEVGSEHNAPGSIWECPDLFPLEVDGQTKWVLIASVMGGGLWSGRGTRYLIGDFDGKTFTDETNALVWLDHGPDNYAGVTFNNTPDGSRIFMGWMNNWSYATHIPTSTWRGAMTIPRKLELRRTRDGLRLVQSPVPQVDQLRGTAHRWRDQTIVPGSNLLQGLAGRAFDIVAEFQPGSALTFGFRVLKRGDQFTTIGYDTRSSALYVDRACSGNTGFHPEFSLIHRASLPPIDGRIQLRILVDWSSVEVFGNHGEVAITDQVFPDADSAELELFAAEGEVKLVSLDVFPMNRVWA